MVFQKRGYKQKAESKNKMPDKGSQQKKVDVESKKNVEESSLSSEDLSNDTTMSANRGSDDPEGAGSAGESSNSSSPDSDNGNKKSKILFEPGLRLEAKDLGNEIWYAVKVVEVDWEEEEILIHFEKWSQRYDEWISMDSSRLRPIQEETAAKIPKKSSSKVFRVGDRVNATWSDSRKYPATVKAVLPGDKYEVLFMDGYTKVIKGARMAKLKPSDMINAEEFDPEKLGVFKVPEKPPAPPVLSPLVIDEEVIGTKEQRRERKRKLNVAELFHVNKRTRRSPSLSPGRKTSDSEAADKSMDEEKADRLDQEDSESEVKKEEIAEPSDVVTKSETGSETDAKSNIPEVTDEPPKIKEEIEEKPRRKATPKDEEEVVKPRRQGRRSTRTSESSGDGRRGPRRRKPKEEKGDEGTSSSLNDAAAVPGTSQDSSMEEVPKSKKGREDGEKPVSRKFIPDNWEPEGEPAYIVESADGLRKSIIVADERLPEGWVKHMIQRKGGHSAGKWDVFFVCPEGRKFRSRHELRNYFEERGEVFLREQFDFSLGRRKLKWKDSNNTSSQYGQHSAVSKPPTTPTPADVPVRRVKTLLPKVRLPQQDDGSSLGSDGPRSPLPPHTTTVTSTGPDDAPGGAVLVGSLKIQMENDAYICPKEGCDKHFRKENLLQMHLKHYHPEYNKFMGSTPNVADLAYARTIGEPVEDLIPKSRYTAGSPMFLDKFHTRFEAARKSKSMVGVPSPSQLGAAASAAPDFIPYDRRKSQGKPGGHSHGAKKTFKGESESVNSDLCLTSEDSTSLPERPCEPPPVLDPAVPKEEPQQSTIKTLLPVVRAPADLTLVERLKMRCPTEDTVGDALLGKDHPPDLSLQHQLPPVLQPQVPSTSQSPSLPSQTKSMRTVKRKHMSDFHMEPIMKKRKSVKPPELLPEDVELAEDGTLLGCNKRKLPVVHLEKLATTTDSNASAEGEDRCKSPQPDSENPRVEQLRKEEIINCICGYNEEDGLMIQCDLCLCWQHGLCSKIEKEEDVPEKYVCPICQNPPRERKSRHYLHDQDWLKEGKLPSLSFTKQNPEKLRQSEMVLKRTMELVGTLHQLNEVLHSLGVKCNIVEAKDHPKLYLWARSWLHQDPEKFKESVPEFLRKDQPMYEPSTSQVHMPGGKTNYEETAIRMKEEPGHRDSLYSSPDFERLVLTSDIKEEESTEPFPAPMSEDEFTSLIPSEGGCARATPLVRRDKRTPTQHPSEKPETASDESAETTTDNANVSIGSVENYDINTDSANTAVGSVGDPETCTEETGECSVENAEHSTETTGAVENAEPSTENTEEAKDGCTENSGPITDDQKPTVSSTENAEIPTTDNVEMAVDSTDNTKLSAAEAKETPVSTDNTKLSAADEKETPDSTEIAEPSTQNAQIAVDSLCDNERNASDAKTSESSDENSKLPGHNANGTASSNENAETSIDSDKTDITSSTNTESAVDTTESSDSAEGKGTKEEDKLLEEIKPETRKEMEMDVETSEAQEETAATLGEMCTPVEEAVENIEETVGLPELTVQEEVVEDGAANTEEEDSMKPQTGEYSMPPPPPPVEGNLLHRALTNRTELAMSKEVDLRKQRLRQFLAAKVQQAYKKRAPVPEPLIDTRECKLRLLDHVDYYHQLIEERQTSIEAQLTALEQMDAHSATDENPEFCPRAKQTILMLLRDLKTLERLGQLF